MKKAIYLILGGVFALGAMASISSRGKKEKEPETEAAQFSFAELDDPNGGWVMENIDGNTSFEDTVLRVYAVSLENGIWLVNSREDWYAFGFYQSAGKLVGDYSGNGATGTCEFVDENNFRYVEESGSITITGTSIDYTSYIDVYLGEKFSLKVETIEGIKTLKVKTENLFYDGGESPHAVVYVKDKA